MTRLTKKQLNAQVLGLLAPLAASPGGRDNVLQFIRERRSASPAVQGPALPAQKPGLQQRYPFVVK